MEEILTIEIAADVAFQNNKALNYGLQNDRSF